MWDDSNCFGCDCLEHVTHFRVIHDVKIDVKISVLFPTKRSILIGSYLLMSISDRAIKQIISDLASVTA
jgi:hypothetical protein